MKKWRQRTKYERCFGLLVLLVRQSRKRGEKNPCHARPASASKWRGGQGLHLTDPWKTKKNSTFRMVHVPGFCLSKVVCWLVSSFMQVRQRLLCERSFKEFRLRGLKSGSGGGNREGKLFYLPSRSFSRFGGRRVPVQIWRDHKCPEFFQHRPGRISEKQHCGRAPSTASAGTTFLSNMHLSRIVVALALKDVAGFVLTWLHAPVTPDASKAGKSYRLNRRGLHNQSSILSI